MEWLHCQPTDLITVRVAKATFCTCAATIGMASTGTYRATLLVRIHAADTKTNVIGWVSNNRRSSGIIALTCGCARGNSMFRDPRQQ